MSDYHFHKINSEPNINLVDDWENSPAPLAPLSTNQSNIVFDLCHEINAIGHFSFTVKEPKDIGSEPLNKEDVLPKNIETTKDFLTWHFKKENEWLDKEDDEYQRFYDGLSQKKAECQSLLAQVEKSLKILRDLLQEYQAVSQKTNSLHEVSEKLISDQIRLTNIRDDVADRLNHFKAIDKLTQALDSAALSVHSSNLESVLDQLNDHIKYISSHPQFKESWSHASRYRQCLRRLLNLIKDYIICGFAQASQQASITSSSHYARFQSAAHNLKPLLSLIESRTGDFPEYEEALTECHISYTREREALISPSVQKTVAELVIKSGSDHCTLMRSACAFLIHVSQDEHRLYHQFFTVQTEIFDKYLGALCLTLYDKIRPMIIHMKHLESLSELCSILRLEMIHEHVNNNREALSAFGEVAEQLLHDVQERLIFRAYMYLRNDVAFYKPSPGDLAYPEKLYMMQSIAQSLHEQSNLTRSESRSSLASIGSLTSQEVARINNSFIPSSSSPADLHGMWYPPVRRTLLCLSRLYRCVERPIFQGISQEALTVCMESIQDAATQISANKTSLDGEMFQIKHLLILREQIAPFQVDFTCKEITLDLSKMKTAVVQLFNKKSRLFSLSSNNALLEFLLEGSPEVKELWLDSRKDVDKKLKLSCESFIHHATEFLLGPLLSFVEKAENWTPKEKMKEEPWGHCGALSELVQSTTKKIKSNLPELQKTMQLYLANKDTEFILYRPIKNNVVGCFSRLQQVLALSGYTTEEQAQIGCLSPEQASILLSSASLSSNQTSS